MHMLYNSDSFAVVAFDIPPRSSDSAEAKATPRGGFEIVDKFAQKDIFLEGELAERFKAGALELMAGGPSPEDIDDYIAGFAAPATQPLVLH